MRRFQLMLKRAVDITVAVVLLPFAFVVCCVAALIVQSAYPGWPLFLWQKRVGKDCQLFEMIKLRTMPVDHTTLDNPKIRPPLRIKLIRLLGIDELSQLLHVLTGTMSLIGNRPLLEEEWYARYGSSAIAVAGMRPGILNSYSLDGRSRRIGEVPVVSYTYDFQAVSEALAYTDNWSLAHDLKVLRDLFKLVGYYMSKVLAARREEQ